MPRIPNRTKVHVKFRGDDVVLGRVTGYPKWPAMIVKGSQVPDPVRAEFVRTNKEYIVRFIPAADYYFFNGSQLEPLDGLTASDFFGDPKNAPSKKLPEGLREGYEIAQDDPQGWARKQDDVVARSMEAAQEESEEKDEYQGSGEEEEEDEGAEEVEAEGTAKEEEERSLAWTRSHILSHAARRSTQRASTSTRSVRTSHILDDDEEAAVTEALLEAKAPPRKRARTSRGNVRTNGRDAPALKPADVFVSTVAITELVGNLKVKCWRFELQRIFLSKEGVLLDSLDRAAEQFDMLESFPSITAQQIHFSKINKVLKKIIGLKRRLPADAETKYRFTARASKLLQNWQPLLDVEPNST